MTPRGSTAAESPRGNRAAVLPRAQQVFLALSLPVLLLAAGARLVATPVFLWLEYHRPGFPADRWGMTTEQRMTYGSYGLDYIMNLAPPQYLGDLARDEGGVLFLPQEVSHMRDVQHVMQWGLVAATVLLLLSALSCLYLHRRAPGAVWGALFFGSWLTVALLVVLAVTALFGWELFFTLFHSLFFDAGSWTFRVDDTLIRLYPTQFWMDAAITVALVAGLGAVALILVTRRRVRTLSHAGAVPRAPRS